jgi:hypothetical protein
MMSNSSKVTSRVNLAIGFTPFIKAARLRHQCRAERVTWAIARCNPFVSFP